jgi:hypothetical protein
LMVVRKERAYEKFAWVFPLIPSSFFVLIGMVGIVSVCTSTCLGTPVPASTPPDAISLLTTHAQLISLFELWIGILMVAVAWTGLRRAQKWAWYALLWFFLFSVANDFRLLEVTIRTLLVTVPSGIGLLLAYGKFFPKK